MRTGKRSGATVTGKRTASVIVCSTLATNGISRPACRGAPGAGGPAGRSTRQIFPSPHTTSPLVSGSHAYCA